MAVQHSPCDRFEWCEISHTDDDWGIYDPGIEVRLHEQHLRPGRDDDSPVLALEEYRDEDTHHGLGVGSVEVCLAFDGSWQPISIGLQALAEAVSGLAGWLTLASRLERLPRYTEHS